MLLLGGGEEVSEDLGGEGGKGEGRIWVDKSGGRTGERDRVRNIPDGIK